MALINSGVLQNEFNAGLLSENGFTTPWQVIKRRLENKGIDVRKLPKTPAPKIAALNTHPNPYSIRELPELIGRETDIRRALNTYVTGVGLKGASVSQLNSVYAAFDIVLGRFNLDFESLRWTNKENVGGFYDRSIRQMALGRMVSHEQQHLTPGVFIEMFLGGKPERVNNLRELLQDASGDRADLIRE